MEKWFVGFEVFPIFYDLLKMSQFGCIFVKEPMQIQSSLFYLYLYGWQLGDVGAGLTITFPSSSLCPISMKFLSYPHPYLVMVYHTCTCTHARTNPFIVPNIN